MTKPEKDEVLETFGQTKPGGEPISFFGGAAKSTTRSAEELKEPSASGVASNASVEGASSVPEPSTDATGPSEEMLEKALAEMQEWKDKFVRLHAEWDTYRRRMIEQRMEEKANATEKLVEHLLPVIDDFERTIDYADKKGESGLLDGVKAVKTKLVNALEKEGVQVLDPRGDAFDALECQAINTLENRALPDETVAEVYQKGYKMGKKVLRPAMVTVAIGGPKREVPKDTE